MDSHKVKPKTVQIIFFGPKGKGIYHKLAEHGAFASSGIAPAGLVIIGQIAVKLIIIVWHNLVKIRIPGITGMAVGNIHNYLDSCVMQCLDHFFHLCDTDISILWIAGI